MSAASFPKVVVTKHGGADVLEFQAASGDVAAMKGAVAEGQIVVDNKFAGVNFIDTYFRSGLYPNTPPFTNGQEGAGTIVSVGSGVDVSLVGKNVSFWGTPSGSYAGCVTVGANQYTVLPENTDLKQAAAVTLQGLTSHYLTHDTYKVKEGDWVLVHAAAGGCGLLISQMCKLKGATVIGTVSSEEKAALAKTVGKVDHIINYTATPDFQAEVRALVPAGVHVVYDGVGKDTFEGSLGSLRPRGTLASFGNASGAVPPVAPLALTKAGSLFLTRPTLAHYVSDPVEREQRTRDVFTWLQNGSLTATVGLTLPLSEARAAQEVCLVLKRRICVTKRKKK